MKIIAVAWLLVTALAAYAQGLDIPLETVALAVCAIALSGYTLVQELMR